MSSPQADINTVEWFKYNLERKEYLFERELVEIKFCTEIIELNTSFDEYLKEMKEWVK